MNQKGWNREEGTQGEKIETMKWSWKKIVNMWNCVALFSHCCEIMFVHARIFLDLGSERREFEAHKHIFFITHARMQMLPIECSGNDEDDDSHFDRVRERERKKEHTTS